MSWWGNILQIRSNWRSGHSIDAGIAVFWLAVGWVLFIGRYQGQFPYLDLDSDTAQIASFAAAQSNPGAFKGDFLLSDPRNYGFYYTLQIPLARALRLLVGDLGLAFIVSLPVLVLAQGFGFYLLGKVLFRHRFLGFLFSIATLPVIRITPLADYWGTRGLATPRDWFQAILPFLLAAALTRGSSPRGRLLVMAMAGGLMYVHPVSTPPWACAVWLGLWWVLPPAMTLRERAIEMARLAGVFLLVSAPFFVQFLMGGKQEVVPASQVLEAFKYRYKEGYFDLGLTLTELLRLLNESWTAYFGVAGVIVLWIHRVRVRGNAQVVVSWLAGLVLIGILVPWIDHSLAARAGRVPAELDLIRSIRYLFPFGWMVGLWALGTLAERSGQAAVRAISYAISAAFVCSLFVRFPAPDFLGSGWQLMKAGIFLPSQKTPSPMHEALDAAKQTPAGSRFFVTNMKDASLLRIQALRPVVFSYKDGGALSYSNHRSFLDWYKRDLVFSGLFGRADKWQDHSLTDAMTDRMVEIARAWNAEYILYTGFMLEPPPGTQRVYENSTYTLLKL